MGLTWLGVIPLLNGLVVEMFGIKFLSTLTGIAFFSHQVGSFLGAWGGGAIFDALGSYDRALQFGVIVGPHRRPGADADGRPPDRARGGGCRGAGAVTVRR